MPCSVASAIHQLHIASRVCFGWLWFLTHSNFINQIATIILRFLHYIPGFSPAQPW